MNALVYYKQMFDKLPADWLRFAVLLLVLMLLLWVVRMVSRVNRALLLVCFVIGMAGLVSSWVRNRTEPSFLTPVVDVVAPYFPTTMRTIDL